MKRKNHFEKGVSLIVLVITIVVIVILAVAIVLSIANNNPIESAKEATNKNNEATLQETAQIIYNEWYQKNELNQFADNQQRSLTAQEYIREKLQSDYGYTQDEAEIVRVSVIDGSVAVKYGAKHIIADDYGKYVINYTTPSKIESDKEYGIGGWQIFYADEENIYLIADDYMNKKYDNKLYGDNYKLSMTYRLSGYNGTSDIADNLKKLNRMYFDKGYSTTNDSAKSVALMLDTNRWNKNFKNEKYAEWAIGGPSLEMFVNSYNNYYTRAKIDIEATNSNGYKVKLNNENTYHWSISGLDNSSDNVYIRPYIKAVGMFLCTMGAQNTKYDIFLVQNNGELKNVAYSHGAAGFRPLVALKANVLLKKVQDGFEIID